MGKETMAEVKTNIYLDTFTTPQGSIDKFSVCADSNNKGTCNVPDKYLLFSFPVFMLT